MTTLAQIEQSLRRIETSMFPHPTPQLFDLSTVAEEPGFRPAALVDILAAELRPEPRPVLNAGCYLFERRQVSNLWVWLVAGASDQECSEVAGHMVRHDPALQLVTPGDDAREFVLWAMWEERGGRCYSDRFHLVLDAQVLLTVAEKQSALERLLAAPGPPWRPIPSRDLKKFLGVSSQSLANWRVRETGPEHEAFIPGLGNKVHYRPDRVMAWLSGTRHAWEYSADWLAAHGVGVDNPSEDTVRDRVELLERLNVLR